MKTLTEAGAMILPATPSFYSRPKTFEELALTVIDRAIDAIGIEQDTKRWQS
jgi:4-hydroxy-3-polyprenylbenzoate decarboxylase